MIHILAKIKKIYPHFNRRPLTEFDFWRACRQENIYVHFWKLKAGVNGFYGVNLNYKIPRKYIVISLDLLRSEAWLLTGFHELFHHFLHIPKTKTKVYFSSEYINDTQDTQADLLSHMALIPLPKLIELMHTPFEQIFEFPIQMLIERKSIYEKYGI